jgi:hypothetical protein
MGAFAGELSDDDLETLRADSRVEAIEEDGVMKAFANVAQYAPLIRPLWRVLMELDQEQRSLGLKSNIL